MPTTHDCKYCGDWIKFSPRFRFNGPITKRDIAGGVWVHAMKNPYCGRPTPKDGVTPEDNLRLQGKEIEGD